MRTLIGIALAVVGMTSANAALQPTPATAEKPSVTAAAQRVVSDFTTRIVEKSLQAPASCQLLQKTEAFAECGIEDASLLASAPPRRPPRRTRRK